MDHAFKKSKGDKSKEYPFRIDHWAETVAPRFDLEKGEKTVTDYIGEDLVFGIAGWPEDRTLKGDHSLQLGKDERNPPKPSEEELAAIAKSETDYFAQNNYFIDESGDGRFPSQTSHSSQTQSSIKHSMRQGPNNWVCTLCGAQSIEGDDAYYQHLDHSHTADMEETGTDIELWKRSMLDEAYWNGVDGITPTPIAQSSRPKSFILKDEGRCDEAEELTVQVMETNKKVLGEEHPDTLTSMINLAWMYFNQGRCKEAEELIIQVIKTNKKMLGEEHPDTLTSMANLARIYSKQGRWKKAEELMVQVMGLNKKMLGKEHSDTLSSMNDLVSIYSNQGRWSEAEALGEQVLKMKKRVLGKEHPSKLSSMANLVSIYSNQGRWSEAEALGEQVLKMKKRVLGKEHPSTLSSMANLVSIYSNQECWSKAISLMENCFELQKRILGPEHPDTESSRQALYKWKNEVDEHE
ncbi:MAG: hypothetical protein M1836_002255 [Candelina mexicana]|nr:MAG: hypothetical protein M1836_002255 [Candelina mexicana]